MAARKIERKRLIHLKLRGDLSDAEIGMLLGGVTPQAVRQHLKRIPPEEVFEVAGALAALNGGALIQPGTPASPQKPLPDLPKQVTDLNGYLHGIKGMIDSLTIPEDKIYAGLKYVKEHANVLKLVLEAQKHIFDIMAWQDFRKLFADMINSLSPEARMEVLQALSSLKASHLAVHPRPLGEATAENVGEAQVVEAPLFDASVSPIVNTP